MELFFAPEIARRKAAQLIKEDFQLHAAQALFFPDGRPPLVKLNEEVAVIVKLKKGVDLAVKDFRPLLEQIESVQLHEKEFLNCGHSTLIEFKDGTYLTFDFHYNKALCGEHLTVASEFLKTAQYALDKGLGFAFIDNCFSTTELLTKTNLFLEANNRVSEKATHKAIKSAYNLRFKHSKVDFEIQRRQIFNQLGELRQKARYLEGSINITQEETKSIFDTIQQMYTELCDRARFVQP